MLYHCTIAIHALCKFWLNFCWHFWFITKKTPTLCVFWIFGDRSTISADTEKVDFRQFSHSVGVAKIFVPKNMDSSGIAGSWICLLFPRFDWTTLFSSVPFYPTSWLCLRSLQQDIVRRLSADSDIHSEYENYDLVNNVSLFYVQLITLYLLFCWFHIP